MDIDIEQQVSKKKRRQLWITGCRNGVGDHDHHILFKKRVECLDACFEFQYCDC